jgi:hypothetical protein
LRSEISEAGCIRALVARHSCIAVLPSGEFANARTSPQTRRQRPDGDGDADALIAKGYPVGPGGANGTFNDDTLTALMAFQDANALPVQAECDQQCWTALGLPGP